MKIQVAIRMRAEARDRLKLISVIEKKPMGDLVEELIDAKYATVMRSHAALAAPSAPQGIQLQLPKPKKHDKKKRGF